MSNIEFIHFYPLLSTSIHFYPLISTYIHLYPLISTLIHFYPLLFVFILVYPLLSTFVQFYPVISTFIHFNKLLSTSINFDPLQSTSIHFYPLLSTFVHFLEKLSIWETPFLRNRHSLSLSVSVILRFQTMICKNANILDHQLTTVLTMGTFLSSLQWPTVCITFFKLLTIPYFLQCLVLT